MLQTMNDLQRIKEATGADSCSAKFTEFPFPRLVISLKKDGLNIERSFSEREIVSGKWASDQEIKKTLTCE